MKIVLGPQHFSAINVGKNKEYSISSPSKPKITKIEHSTSPYLLVILPKK